MRLPGVRDVAGANSGADEASVSVISGPASTGRQAALIPDVADVLTYLTEHVDHTAR